jgi:hypothetical protein
MRNTKVGARVTLTGLNRLKTFVLPAESFVPCFAHNDLHTISSWYWPLAFHERLPEMTYRYWELEAKT